MHPVKDCIPPIQRGALAKQVEEEDPRGTSEPTFMWKKAIK